MVKHTETIRRQKPTNFLSVFNHCMCKYELKVKKMSVEEIDYLQKQECLRKFRSLIPHLPYNGVKSFL